MVRSRAPLKIVPSSPPNDICQVRCVNAELVAQAHAAMPSADVLAETQVLLGALADKSRLKIIYALSHGAELCVCDVAALLDSTIATASHHLRKLRDLKILKYRNDGKLAYYSLHDPRIAEILRYTLQQVVE